MQSEAEVTGRWYYRPYSRQVKLPLLGSFQSRQLVYLKAGNVASSENNWLFRSSFWCTFHCISNSSFNQQLLCMFDNYITACPEIIKNRKLHIWPVFTCVNRIFDIGHPIHVRLLPLRIVCSRNSVYIAVRFPLSDERTWVARQAWWRHQMETFSALLAICAGNSPVSGEFPAQRPVTRSFDVFFDLCPNKRLSKQSWGWWFETPSGSLWRHSKGKFNGGRRHATPHGATIIFGEITWITHKTLLMHFVLLNHHVYCL